MNRDFKWRTAQQQRVEWTHGEPIDVLLRRLYVLEGKTQEGIARELDVTTRTVQRWLGLLGITREERAA